MLSLGLSPTKNSGAGWIEKEDGYNENVLAQLKSTHNNSINIHLDDVDILNYHAGVEGKEPVFIIDFIDKRRKFFVIECDKLENVFNGLMTTLPKNTSDFVLPNFKNDEGFQQNNIIQSSEEAKIKFQTEQAEKYKNRKK